MRKPDFENLLTVLAGGVPTRPTLFEFFLNERLYRRLSGYSGAASPPWGSIECIRMTIPAFHRAGYDYATTHVGFGFPRGEVRHAQTFSLNDGTLVATRAEFERYPWPRVEDAAYENLDEIARLLPDGMKAIVPGPGGVLENAIGLAGYDNLCYAMADDPSFARDLFDAIGSRLARHYEIVAPHPAVGACISNDDWGFKTQPMLSVAAMREYVIPWHRKIAQAIHRAGKPAIFHSCGNLDSLMDDIIDDIGYDAKHSWEDAIIPVEDAYERWGARIAIFGGIDVDFLCRHSLTEISERSQAMLDRVAGRGGYALGSGNSIPGYVPDEAYFAMIAPAVGNVA